MKRIYLGLAVLMCVLVLQTPGFCANMEGTVNNLKPGLITIDMWGDNETADFKITYGTQLKYINSLNALKVGDQVDVYYQGEGYHRVATSIVKVNPAISVPVF